ncbi:transglycosylase SLT domain-containing protein [Patescibacteria group bacterium]|nr:transglycosylase SLT domain-containing protein [Patescibacteria group bacterium]
MSVVSNEASVEIPLESPKIAQIQGLLPELDIEDIIIKYAEIYSVSARLAIDLAKYESNLDPEAKNKFSSARGLYQFLEKSTWSLCEGDIYSPERNAECAMKIIGGSQTGIRHWTASPETRSMLLVKDYVYCMFNSGDNICYLK